MVEGWAGTCVCRAAVWYLASEAKPPEFRVCALNHCRAQRLPWEGRGSSVTEALRGGDAHALTPGRRGDLMPAVSE